MVFQFFIAFSIDFAKDWFHKVVKGVPFGGGIFRYGLHRKSPKIGKIRRF
jgi:hypothetical protein